MIGALLTANKLIGYCGTHPFCLMVYTSLSRRSGVSQSKAMNVPCRGSGGTDSKTASPSFTCMLHVLTLLTQMPIQLPR